MKTSRFTDSQIIGVLKQAETGTPVPGLCREHGFGLVIRATHQLSSKQNVALH